MEERDTRFLSALERSKMSERQTFEFDCSEEIKAQGEHSGVQELSSDWIRVVNPLKYSYHFKWQGRPIIQYPQDIVAMQELIWLVRPNLIIETGIAHGGSLIFSASMLALLDIGDAIESGCNFDPRVSERKVLGIDVDIRKHNREAIEAHPMSSRIEMIEGSSIEPETVDQVYEVAKNYSRILVCLDSNHTHDHALAELEAYAPLTSRESYCVVFDTIIEDLPKEMFPDRPWGPGDNPKTAVWEYLKSHPEFEIDKSIPDKLLITVAPDGFLMRTGG
jgi:cephalosporin hydroxylase